MGGLAYVGDPLLILERRRWANIPSMGLMDFTYDLVLNQVPTITDYGPWITSVPSHTLTFVSFPISSLHLWPPFLVIQTLIRR